MAYKQDFFESCEAALYVKSVPGELFNLHKRHVEA